MTARPRLNVRILVPRPPIISGLSCTGRAQRDPRLVRADVGRRLGRTFSLLEEVDIVTDPSPGTVGQLEERNAAKTARAGEVLFAPTRTIVFRTKWRRKEEGNPQVARDSVSNRDRQHLHLSGGLRLEPESARRFGRPGCIRGHQPRLGHDRARRADHSARPLIMGNYRANPFRSKVRGVAQTCERW